MLQAMVTAANDWDAPAERKQVRPAMEGSYETLFHATGLPAFQIALRDGQASQHLRDPRLERAIGVIYRPEAERMSHYFYARLCEQFDGYSISTTHERSSRSSLANPG